MRTIQQTIAALDHIDARWKSFPPSVLDQLPREIIDLCQDVPDLIAALRDSEMELILLRNAIRSVVTQRADDLCWRDVYTDLAKLVEIKFTPELFAESDKFLANCKRFDASMRSGPYRPVFVGKAAKCNKIGGVNEKPIGERPNPPPAPPRRAEPRGGNP